MKTQLGTLSKYPSELLQHQSGHRSRQLIGIMNDEGVFAETTIEETFEREFGVYDLKKLLALLSMQKSPVLL